MLLLYNILLVLLFVLAFPLLIFKYIFNKNERKKHQERLGFLTKNTKEYLKKVRDDKLVWIHAGSIGEIKIAKILLDNLEKEEDIDIDLIVSTGGSTGKKIAREYWSEKQIVSLPIDLPWVMNKTVKKINPDLFILIETDLWPNLIYFLSRHNVKIIMINGWFKHKFYNYYKLLPGLLKKLLKKFDLIGVQTNRDKKILQSYSIDKIKVTGNLKFSIDKFNIINQSEIKEITDEINSQAKEIIVAGSTHKNEEEKIYEVFYRLKKKYKNLLLIIAPRDINRSKKLEKLAKSYNFNTGKKTEIKKDKNYDVIILNTVGELAQFYSIATVAFVGGSLVKKGGHNLLEPAIYGKPVLWGPYIGNVKNLASILENNNVGKEIGSKEELRCVLDNLLHNKEKLKNIQKRADHMFEVQETSLDENISIIKDFLE
ncbi:MAG: 3-deoxy-D-manno-octulosonic acid transferase [Nanoarchaeota archaeon]